MKKSWVKSVIGIGLILGTAVLVQGCGAKGLITEIKESEENRLIKEYEITEELKLEDLLKKKELSDYSTGLDGYENVNEKEKRIIEKAIEPYPFINKSEVDFIKGSKDYVYWVKDNETSVNIHIINLKKGKLYKSNNLKYGEKESFGKLMKVADNNGTLIGIDLRGDLYNIKLTEVELEKGINGMVVERREDSSEEMRGSFRGISDNRMYFEGQRSKDGNDGIADYLTAHDITTNTTYYDILGPEYFINDVFDDGIMIITKKTGNVKQLIRAKGNKIEILAEITPKNPSSYRINKEKFIYIESDNENNVKRVNVYNIEAKDK